METTGKAFSKLIEAYESAGKKGAIAIQLGESESQLSKLVHTHGPKLCRLLDLLGLELTSAGYLSAVETVLREKLK